MNKKVLIISSTPRKGGNSDLLCDEFATAAAHEDDSKLRRMQNSLWSKRRAAAPQWEIITSVLDLCDWNKSVASSKLGISRGSLCYQVRKHTG